MTPEEILAMLDEEDKAIEDWRKNDPSPVRELMDDPLHIRQHVQKTGAWGFAIQRDTFKSEEDWQEVIQAIRFHIRLCLEEENALDLYDSVVLDGEPGPFFIRIDQESLEEVLAAWRSDTGKLFSGQVGSVKLVHARHQPDGKGGYSAINGCTDYDVGWVKMNFKQYMPIYRKSLDPFAWDGIYVRPPEVLGD